MKKLFLFAFFFAYTQLAFGQEATPPNNTGFGFGFQINQFQRDFGMGILITSPYFASNNVAVRARGHVMFHEHPQDGENSLEPLWQCFIGSGWWPWYYSWFFAFVRRGRHYWPISQ